MIDIIHAFARSDDGAVTVDWVVLTSTLVGLGMAVVIIVSGGIESLSTEIEQHLTATEPVIDPFANN